MGGIVRGNYRLGGIAVAQDSSTGAIKVKVSVKPVNEPTTTPNNDSKHISIDMSIEPVSLDGKLYKWWINVRVYNGIGGNTDPIIESILSTIAETIAEVYHEHYGGM